MRAFPARDLGPVLFCALMRLACLAASEMDMPKFLTWIQEKQPNYPHSAFRHPVKT